MAKSKKKAAGGESGHVDIESINTLELDNVCILGTSPLLLNRLSEKAWRELLMPAPKMNTAEKAMRLKHNPYDEYRASIYRTRDVDAATRIVFPGGAFRQAMSTAALDLPGSSKAQIGRLVRVVQYNVSIFGIPHLCCMIVRQAGINKTPDVRTRAILPEWACRINVKFAHPLLKEKSVISLLAAAGDFCGVGDGRIEKGSSLMCGCFEVVEPSNPRFLRLLAKAGIEAQDKALEHPETFDLFGGDETRELLDWFDAELVRRDHQPASNGNGASRGEHRKKKGAKKEEEVTA